MSGNNNNVKKSNKTIPYKEKGLPLRQAKRNYNCNNNYNSNNRTARYMYNGAFTRNNKPSLPQLTEKSLNDTTPVP